MVVLYNLSQLMAEEIDEPIFPVRGWINGWIAIAVVRSYYRMTHRVHLPSTL